MAARGLACTVQPSGRTKLEEAIQQARGYAAIYDDERAASVVDLVASSQHKYQAALNCVAKFQANYPGTTLAGLATGTFAGCGLDPGR